MRSDWSRESVIELQTEGDLLVEDGNHGEYRPRHDEFGSGQWAFIRAADMDAGRVLFESAQRINNAAFDRIRKGVGKGGDVLFSHKGTVGKLALVPLDAPPFVCSPQTTFWRTLNEKKLDRRYLYYFMQSSAFKEQWTSRKGETDMADYVSLTAQRTFEVIVPPLSEQRAIAGVLGALDGKIEQNRRTSAALERVAWAMFRAWFVDFEPVKAKAAGADSFPSMAQEVFGTLPIRLVDSEIGPVPEEWEIKTLRDVATFVSGGTPSKSEPNYWGGDFPWVSAKDMHESMITDSELRLTTVGRASVRRTAPRHATLMVVRGMSLMTEVRIGWCTREVAFNQDLRAFVPTEDVSPEFLFLWLFASEGDLMRMVDTASHGTGRILTDRLDAMTISLSREVVEAFTQSVRPMIALRETQARESQHLACLRDFLLPKLLSGDVRMREAERAAPEAV